MWKSGRRSLPKRHEQGTNVEATNVLARGYACVRVNDRIVTDAAALSAGQCFCVDIYTWRAFARRWRVLTRGSNSWRFALRERVTAGVRWSGMNRMRVLDMPTYWRGGMYVAFVRATVDGVDERK